MGKPTLPPIGSDVTHLNSETESLPPIGSDVTYLNEQQEPQSMLGKAWDAITSPPNFIKSAQEGLHNFYEPLRQYGESGGARTESELNQLPWYTRAAMPVARGVAATGEAIGNAVMGQATPLNLATAGMASAEGTAAKYGLPKVANVLSGANKTLAAGMAGEGFGHVMTAKTPEQVLGGGLETVLGGMGTMGDMHEVPPQKVNIPDMQVHIPTADNILRNKIDLTPPGPSGPNTAGGEGPLRQQELMDKFGGKQQQPTWKLENGQFIQTPPEEPQFARAEGGGVKIGADVASLGKILGSSLYKGDVTKIATKELLQNSLDAIRPLGDKGHVRVILNQPEKYVEVSDNGAGMTRRELETVFTDLGSSGKREEEGAIGGFGLAKAAPLLAGEKAQVTSVVREGNKTFKHTFEGTPDQLLRGVKINSVEVASNVPTGTTVRTYVPTEDGFYDANEFTKGIVGKSFNQQGKIDLHRIGYKSSSPFEEQLKYSKQDIPRSNYEGGRIIPVDTDYAKMDIIIPKDAKLTSTNIIKFDVLNNGMFQHTGSDWKMGAIPNIPDKIAVNIKSKVPEGDPKYPFSANRESLRDEALGTIRKAIDEHIVNPSINQRKDELQKVWNNMPSIPIQTRNGTVDFFTYDTGGGFSPEELETVRNTPSIQRLAKNITETLEDATQTMGYDEGVTDRAVGQRALYRTKTGGTDDLPGSKAPERVGMIFDDTVHGINIPNPGIKGERAVLINPFISFKKLSPDQASANIVHTILHELAHQEAGGHDEDFTVKLGEVYAKYGASNAINAQREIFSTIADPNDPSRYNSEIHEVLQRYTDSRGTADASKDPLVGTGIKSGDKGPEPTRDVLRNIKPSGEAIAKLADAIRGAKPVRAEQEEIYSQERGERVSNAMKVWSKKPTRSGMHQGLKELEGEHTHLDYEPLQLDQKDVNGLYAHIVQAPQLLPFEKFRTGIALGKLLEGQLPQENELRLLSEAFRTDMRSMLSEGGFATSGMGKFLVQGMVNVPKSVMASMDMSAPLRQGLPLASYKSFWTSFDDMFKSFGSERSYQALQESLIQRPKYLLGKQSGLQLTDQLTSREEQFASQIAEKIPIAGRIIRASDRAYSGFLNKLRADTFDALVDKWGKAYGKDITPEAAKSIARFVNVSTGRGSLGRFEKIADELNTVMFSPRLISSRLTMLNPAYYINSDPFVRKEAIRALLSVAGMGLITTSLGRAMGGTTSTNETSPDAGKLRFGRTRLDPYGGFQQYIVAASRLIEGESTSSNTGRTQNLGANFASPTRLSVLGNFTRSKLSPAASFAVDMAIGRDFNGQPVKLRNELADRLTPMVLKDTYDVWKSDPDLLPVAVPAWFGMGLQTYAPNPSNSLQIRGTSVGEPRVR